jgi:hypothetical protein
MFTFRSEEEPFHPYRLLYVHATEKDREIVSTRKRFKT